MFRTWAPFFYGYVLLFYGLGWVRVQYHFSIGTGCVRVSIVGLGCGWVEYLWFGSGICSYIFLLPVCRCVFSFMSMYTSVYLSLCVRICSLNDFAISLPSAHHFLFAKESLPLMVMNNNKCKEKTCSKPQEYT